jgi:hypothetical protein
MAKPVDFSHPRNEVKQNDIYGTPEKIPISVSQNGKCFIVFHLRLGVFARGKGMMLQRPL